MAAPVSTDCGLEGADDMEAETRVKGLLQQSDRTTKFSSVKKRRHRRSVLRGAEQSDNKSSSVLDLQ